MRGLVRSLKFAGLGLVGSMALAPMAHAAPTPVPPKSTVPVDQGLKDAVRRDLGLSWEEYVQRGEVAEKAARLDVELAGRPGYGGVRLDQQGSVVVAGEGEAVRAAARRVGARTEQRPAGAAADVAKRFTSEVGAEGVETVAHTGTGVVVRVQDPQRRRPSGRSPLEFAAANPGVEVVAGRGPAKRHDVYGGEGFNASGTLCSIGFATFDDRGRQGFASAGHCTVDGTRMSAVLESAPNRSLGSAVFSQFGGPGNTANAEGSPGLDLTLFSGSPADLVGRTKKYDGGTVPVIGTAGVVVGSNVCITGRTSRRWMCGKVITTGSYNVEGYKNDVRWVAGFETDIVTQGGDSGGPILQGLRAAGTVSAGYDAWGDLPASTVGAPIGEVAGLRHSVEVWLNRPTVQPGANGVTVTGRIAIDGALPDDTALELRRGNITQRVGINADGTFAYTPQDGDQLTVVSGFSRSQTATWLQWVGSSLGDRVCGLRDSGCYQVFTGGSLYSSVQTAPNLVRGAIYDKWASMGWENSALGYPTSGERCGYRDSGCYQTFQGGSMYWSPATGAHPVWGAIGDLWASMRWENGRLGYPTSDEFCGLRDGGCGQHFQGGSIYWSPATGAQPVWGAIRGRYEQLGWENSALRYPKAPEFCGLVDGGCGQHFQGGSIYWSLSSGAWPVWGAIRDHWAANGYEWGRLGYPVGPEQCANGACKQAFQRGTITWSASGGARG
ncbi:hypothetical protein GCM10027418_02270 [Mariniluteicoccus endophyticus]